MLWTWHMYHLLAQMNPCANRETGYRGTSSHTQFHCGSEVMCIVRKYPNANWKRLWINLHATWISDAQKSALNMVIHNVTPTNGRLAAINISETNRCSTCGADDTIQHRLTQSGVSQLIRNWTRARIAAIPRKNSLQVPEEWIL